MKIENIRPWMIISAAVSLLIYGGTVAIAWDQIKTRDKALAKAEAKIAAYKKMTEITVKGLDKIVVDNNRASGLLNNAIEQAEKAQKSLAVIDNQRKTEEKINKEITDLQTKLQNSPASPHEMTAEEKLAAYQAGGIQGVPAAISKSIVAKASTERYAFTAVNEIERQAKGYLDVVAYDKPGTRIPLQVRDAISAEVKRVYPDNWSMIADEINRQTEAFYTIQSWQRTGVPGLDARQSAAAINKAIRDNPSTWTRVVSDVNWNVTHPGR